MKKILIVSAIILSFASSSFATITALATNTVTTNAGSQLYGADTAANVVNATTIMAKLSTGVSFYANYTNAGYAIFTKHLKGSKIFGTAYDSTAISWKTGTNGTLLVNTDGGTATALPSSGWTTM